MKIQITSDETRRVTAIVAHMRQIGRTAVRGGQLLRPIEMDHGELLLSSASLRALFFDKEGPVLTPFLAAHDIEIEVECLESDFSMALLSHHVPDQFHVSDFLMQALLDPELKKEHPLDQPKEILLAHDSREGYETLISQPEIWVPTREESLQINGGPSHLTNMGPAQLAHVCRRRPPLSQWGKIPIGRAKAVAITRSNIISYVANKFGGVHYDKERMPSAEDDKAQFKALASAYDMDSKAIMHAGLVAVALACIEIVSNDDFGAMWRALREFHDERQARLSALKGAG